MPLARECNVRLLLVPPSTPLPVPIYACTEVLRSKLIKGPPSLPDPPSILIPGFKLPVPPLPTVSKRPGLAVPIPTFPPFVTTRFVAVEDPMANDGPEMPFGFTESWAQGEGVP